MGLGGSVFIPSSQAKVVRGTCNGVSPGIMAAAVDYGALDVMSHSGTVGAAWVFAGMARQNGGGGKITKMAVLCSVEAWAAQYRLTLFNTVPTTSELDDNLVGAITIAEAPNIVAIVVTTVDSADIGTVSYGEIALAVPVPYVCAAGSTTLYGILQTVAGETNEAASMTVDVLLTIEQD